MADDDQVMGILSELPEPIIHHILSFLAIKDATKTSVLSKAWLRAWRTRPTLEFDCYLLNSKEFNQPSSEYLKKIESTRTTDQKHKKYRKGLKYMRSTLLRYLDQKIGLETFNLSITPTFSGESIVEECIDLAVENKVKNLDLYLPRYLLTQKVLEAKSLATLSIKSCVLKEQEIRCCRLKRLNLHFVNINEEVFENIMSSCQLIEDLEITYCKGIAVFKVTKLRHLKQFNALLHKNQRENQRVEVEAPSLELLTCMHQYFLGMEIPCCLNLPASQYQNLKSLSLGSVEISVNFFDNMENKFPHLEDLCIQYCQNLQRIKISSQSLKKIQLAENKFEVAQFDVPSIDRFEYSSCYWSKDIMPQFSFTAASSCWSSHINILYKDSMDSSWFLKLREFLSRLTPSEISILVVFAQDVPSSVEVMENSVTLPEPQEIKEFWVNFYEKLSLPSVLSVLDNIFWTCRPHTIWHVYDKKFTKLVYDMLMFRKNQGHPNLQNFKKFWQHDLKDVKVYIFNYGLFLKWSELGHDKMGQGVQLPEALNWVEFCNVLNARKDKKLICFNLEWTKSDMHN